MKNKEIEVVIRYISNNWCIAHANSYQSAFRYPVNSFDKRENAIKFAQDNGCKIVHHSYDMLQNDLNQEHKQ